MRAIKPGQIAIFLCLLALILALGIGTTCLLSGLLSPGDFRGMVLLIMATIWVYAYAILVYRCLLHFNPLNEGVVAENSRHELVANINILFYLMLFNSLIRTHVIPVPVMRLIYLALGAELGNNTYSAGVLLDPPLTRIGSNTIIGHDAVIFAHVIEGGKLELKTVIIGNAVTIGATAVVMAGVRIEDHAIVSAGAVVTKDTHIGKGEIWGGVPARRLRPAADTA